MRRNISTLVFALFLMCYNVFNAATITSNGTGGGNWNTGASWSGGTAPGIADDVVITSTDVITIRSNVTCASITISGTLQIGNSTTNRTLTCNGNLSIQVTGTFTANPSFAATQY